MGEYKIEGLELRDIDTLETVLAEKAAELRISGADKNNEFYDRIYKILTKTREILYS